MEKPPKKRITLKPKSPNRCFETWLLEWRDEAKQKGSRMEYCFTTALASLRKYPLPLQTGRDCKILNGFGDKLCEMLDKKLAECKGQAEPQKRSKRSPVVDKGDYTPLIGSGSYAILLTLQESNGEMLKKDIIKKGQVLSNTSFTKPGPNTRYTAWSSMATLLQKGLVKKAGNPARFTLTAAGKVTAEGLSTERAINSGALAQCQPLTSTESEAPMSKTKPGEQGAVSKLLDFESVVLPPDSFQIILIIDNHELHGQGKHPEADPIVMELIKHNVAHEFRSLKIGDYAWICRKESTELVLPYIIERKRMDDLASSIKDTRFHEQKSRLKQCGIQNLIYLIESHGRNERLGLPIENLYQAASNTLIQDGFSVKFTASAYGSSLYLASLTKSLVRAYKGKTLMSCPKSNLERFDIEADLVPAMHFKEFNQSAVKTKKFTTSEMFLKQLVQIKGMSVEKALAVVERYPTARALWLDLNTGGPAEDLLTNIRYGTTAKRLGPVLSKTVYQLFANFYP